MKILAVKIFSLPVILIGALGLWIMLFTDPKRAGKIAEAIEETLHADLLQLELQKQLPLENNLGVVPS